MNFLKRFGLKILAVILILICVSVGALFALTPTRLAYPKNDHFHLRMQYIFHGQAEDFSTPRYQTDYLKDVCNGSLTESPIHFHDNKDQITHLHWRGMTGGDMLKFYGLNKVGGLDGYMGYKLDEITKFPPKITPIPIHSQSLPKPNKDDQFFVYTGDKDKFDKKDFNDFTTKSLEEFLGKNSTLREGLEAQEKQTTFNPFGPIDAEAHAGITHQTFTEEQKHNLSEKERKDTENRNNQVSQNQQSPAPTPTGNPSEEELKQINNLIGNIVLFVQPNEPTQDQIKARFQNLEPLGLSVCGG
jgi:hypothetical protein